MVKILSWDVGIKNLAYCIINKNEEPELVNPVGSVGPAPPNPANPALATLPNPALATLPNPPNPVEKFTIDKWGIINLSDTDKNCKFIIRGGTPCDKNSCFEIYNKDKLPFTESYDYSINVCANHKDKISPCFSSNPELNPNPNIKCVLCKKIACTYIANTSYSWCADHEQANKSKLLKKICIKKITNSCMKQPIQTLSEKLINCLDQMKNDFFNVNEVLIENQPTLKNPTMKTIATILLTYFITRGIIDKIPNKSLISHVRFIAPSKKLSIGGDSSKKILADSKANELNEEKPNSKSTYIITKTLGIKYCKALISQKDNEILMKYKKKDDMADAFLQGFRYLFNPLPEFYVNKLKNII